MTRPLVECVPNFSEGRDLDKIEQILDAIRGVEGIDLLDVDPGAETNRTVVTFVGAPEPVGEAAFAAIAKAAEVLDMTTHQGAHSRHGATDVCPFVPVSDVTMEDCVQLAEQVGQRVGEELGLPVYLYDEAARLPERRSLAKVRAGEYEALSEKLSKPEWAPDFGPATFNPKAGVVTIGAREFLIAYNVNLNTMRKDQADDIAGEVRETGRALRHDQTGPYYNSGALVKYWPSKGIYPSAYDEFVGGNFEELDRHYREELGRDLAEELEFFGRDPENLEGMNVMRKGTFAHCRGVGWVIPEYSRAQISFNLTNFKVTPPHVVLEECRRLAEERGLLVTGSEIVGMVPYESIRESGEWYLRRQGSSLGVPVKDVIETAVQSMGLRDVSPFDPNKLVLGMPADDNTLASMKVHELVDEVSRASPAPGGGSISALSGSLGAALVSMVANLTYGKKGFEEHKEEMESIASTCQDLKDQLLQAVDDDTEAFGDVLTAMRMAKDTEEEKAAREQAIQEGYKRATSVPFHTAELCLAAMVQCSRAAEKGMPASLSDAGVAALVARAGVLGAIANVRINLPSIKDESWKEELHGRLATLEQDADAMEAQVRSKVQEAL